MPEPPLFLGIEIGGTKLQLATGAANGKIISNIRLAVEAGCSAATIRQQVKAGLRELDTDAVKAIGVGFGGPVDHRGGTICTSHQVAGWNSFNLVLWLQELTGKPVALENDANTAALAEALYGSGRGYGLVFYMTIGSGIGGGFINNGRIYHGKIPGELEIGHIRLNKEGTTLEDRCSGWAVDQKVKEAIRQKPRSLLAQLSAQQHGPPATLLLPSLDKEDDTAAGIIHEIADELAFALSHVVHLIHPDVIVIGGGLSLLKEHLLAPVRDRLPCYVMKAFLPPPPLKLALLEEDVVPVGAMELARQLFQQKIR